MSFTRSHCLPAAGVLTLLLCLQIGNRIKAKGLQKLRWYCQMCQKQCRDENGFKCHLTSESHKRQMMVFGQAPMRGAFVCAVLCDSPAQDCRPAQSSSECRECRVSGRPCSSHAVGLWLQLWTVIPRSSRTISWNCCDRVTALLECLLR